MAGTVLLAQRDQLIVDHARIPARVVQQHEGEQPVHLGLVGHQLSEQPPEPDRLGGEIRPIGVALVEDEVDDREHRAQAVRQPVVGGHRERDRGRLDLRLGSREPALHRLLGDQERPRDLLGREAAEGAQRQRHLRVDSQRRMAAGEDQLQTLVGDRGVVEVELVHGRGRSIGLQQPGLVLQGSLTSKAVDGAVAPGHHQPRHRVLRRSLAGPALGGDRKCLLGGLLGEVDVAKEPDQ